MPSTFIDLTNELLRSFGEVPFESEADFLSARSTQARAKDAIKSACNEINQQTHEWPFNAVENTQLLIPGVVEYTWADRFKSVDWKSFILPRSDAYNSPSTKLVYIDRDEWYDTSREEDTNASLVGISKPHHVFPSHGTGFGVSPSPDKPYVLRYRYYRTPPELVNASDQTTIPVEFNNVIMAGASYYMQLFRDNAESTQIVGAKFQELISNMRRNLLGNYDRMRDSRVAY